LFGARLHPTTWWRHHHQTGPHSSDNCSSSETHPKPPEAKQRPVVSHSSSSITTKLAAAATYAIPSMDDPPSFCYQDVVCKKTEQEGLNTYECEECGKSMDALFQDNAKGVFQHHELMCASRHRAHHPKNSPTFFGNQVLRTNWTKIQTSRK
jgi:hypothetical protein